MGGRTGVGAEEIAVKTIDVQSIILCAVIAAVGTFGILAGAAAFLGISLHDYRTAVSAIGGLCGIGLWGVLLAVNWKTVVKQV